VPSVQDFLAKKNYAKALELIRADLARRPRDSRLRLQQADILILAGRGKEAVSVLLGLADEHARDGFAAKAIAVLKRVEKIEPGRRDVEERLVRLIQEKVRDAPSTPRPAAAMPEIGLEEFDPSTDIGMEAPAPAPAPEVEPEPETQLEPAAEVEPEPEAPELPVEAEAGPETLPDLSAEAEPLVMAEAQPTAEEEPAPELEIEPEPEVEATPEVEAEPELEAEPEVEAAPEVQAKAKRAPAAAPEAATIDDSDLEALDYLTPAEGEGAPEPQPILSTPLFEGFSEQELLAVMRGMNLRTFAPGDILMAEGAPGDSLFVLTTGTVKCWVKDRKGHYMKVQELPEGAFFGEISVLTGKPRTATLTAAAECEALELDKKTLDEITAKHPHVREVLKKFHEQRAQDTVQAILKKKR
jgi:hypothetical protein